MQQKDSTFNEADGNARPYCVSLDWLSVSCRDQGFLFLDREEQPSGYKLVKMDHGSKCFAYLADIYDPHGQHIGELQAIPYNKAMDSRSVIVKADNELLYQADGVEQFFACITALALYYRGINRLDLACDQNEFYGGLLPTNLIRRYLDREYLKIGCNHLLLWMDLGYHGVVNSNGLTAWSKMPLVDEKARHAEEDAIREKNEELAKVGLPLLDPSPAHAIDVRERDHVYTSVTWGTRGNGVQVQLYNKTKELQEKKLKHYIVDAWKNAGLDVSRDVYRVEIRIKGRGKGVVNQISGKEFEINLIDCFLQEQIEDFFFAFAERHFKFYKDDGHVKKRQNVEVELWHRRPPILKPKLTQTAKNPSRFTLVLANSVFKEEVAMSQLIKREEEMLHAEMVRRKQANPSAFDADKEYAAIDLRMRGSKKVLSALTAVGDYFRDCYLLKNWLQNQDFEEKYRNNDVLMPLPPAERCSRAFKGSAYAMELYQRIRERCGRAIFSSEAERRRDERRILDAQEEKRYLDSVVNSFRTITYCEYVPKDEYPFPPPSDDLKVDWDEF